MTSMSELRAYKAAEHSLHNRLYDLRVIESKAMVEWQNSNGAEGTLDKWTAAITHANETATCLAHLRRIISEIEGTEPQSEAPLWIGVGHDPSGEQY